MLALWVPVGAVGLAMNSSQSRTACEVRRTKSHALMPFRLSCILRAFSVKSFGPPTGPPATPSRARTMLPPSWSFATRSPRLPHFDVRLRAIFSVPGPFLHESHEKLAREQIQRRGPEGVHKALPHARQSLTVFRDTGSE